MSGTTSFASVKVDRLEKYVLFYWGNQTSRDGMQGPVYPPTFPNPCLTVPTRHLFKLVLSFPQFAAEHYFNNLLAQSLQQFQLHSRTFSHGIAHLFNA